MTRIRASVFRILTTATMLALLAVVLGTSCQATEKESPTPTEPGNGAPAVMDDGVPGVSDSRILFGQSAAFSGPAQALGQGMRLGIQAAFHEQNEKGGVHGRILELTTLDDQYEPHLAYGNTLNLINRERVFALIGEVGTPTSRSASPLANAENVPFIAPFTGADFLREAELENVVNLRASYHQEAEAMVARLTEDLGITRVAVMYQNDSYGQSGLDGVVDALGQRGLEPVAYWYYQRNSDAVKAAVFNIVEANPEAIIMIGAYAPVAKAITVAREDISPIFMAVSFVGSNALARELGPDGAGVYVTQVVPLPDDTNVPAVAAYRAALKAFDANAAPGFVSLEGYLAGRLAIAGLEKCGSGVSRDCFLDALRNSGTIDLNGLTLQYGPGDNQGSDSVFVTVIGDDGKYHLVNNLAGAR